MITLTFFASCTLTLLRRSDFQNGPKSNLFISYQVFKQNLNHVTRQVLVEMHLCAMRLVNYERDTTIEIRIAAAIKEKKILLCFLPCLRRSFIYRWSHLQTFLIQVFLLIKDTMVYFRVLLITPYRVPQRLSSINVMTKSRFFWIFLFQFLSPWDASRVKIRENQVQPLL